MRIILCRDRGSRLAGLAVIDSIVTLWPRLRTIFVAIADGNDDLGIPPYNGGLFDPEASPILARVELEDWIVAKIIFALSHEPDDGAGRGPRYINYRDLSVQQLGAVYERLLEYGLRSKEDGSVEIDADDTARHKSGSYYTPEELVSLVIQRAVRQKARKGPRRSYSVRKGGCATAGIGRLSGRPDAHRIRG